MTDVFSQELGIGTPSHALPAQPQNPFEEFSLLQLCFKHPTMASSLSAKTDGAASDPDRAGSYLHTDDNIAQNSTPAE